MFDKNDYKAAFSKVTASERMKTEVLNMTINREQKKGVSKAARLTIIAALMLLLAACAEVFDAGAMLEAAFGENGRAIYAYEEKTFKTSLGEEVTEFRFGGERSPMDQKLAEELVEPHVFAVNQTAVEGETTMTVLACLHDPVTQTGVIYLKLENPNGFPELYIWNDGRIAWYQEDGTRKTYIQSDPYGLIYIAEDQTTQTELYMTCNYVCQEDDKEITIYFCETGTGVSVMLPEETQMNFLSFAGGDIKLTPIGLACNQTRFDVLDSPTIKILYQDGTEKIIEWHDPYKKKNFYDRTPIKDPVYHYIYTSYWNPDVSAVKSYLLDFIVDMDNVKSIVINDEEFSME